MVWYGTVRYGTVRYGTVWCDMELQFIRKDKSFLKKFIVIFLICLQLLICLLLLVSCDFPPAPAPPSTPAPKQAPEVEADRNAALVIGQVGNLEGSPIGINREAIVKAAGGVMISEPCDFTPEGIITAFMNLIARECDGIVYTPMSESTLPRITKLCEDAGVYWVISMRAISDPQIKQIAEASPFYVGCVFENDEAAGYEIMKALAQNGAREVALLSYSRLDATIEARTRGLNKAAEEFDVRIVAESNNFGTAGDITKVVENITEVYPDLDAIFHVATLVWDAAPAVLDGLAASNRPDHIKLASIDFDMRFGEYFEKNQIAVVAGGHIPLDASIATAMLINAIMGEPIEGNSPLSFSFDYIMLRSFEDFKNFYDMIGDDETPLFTEDQARSMLLKRYNPGLTAQDYQEIIDNYKIDTLNIFFERRRMHV